MPATAHEGPLRAVGLMIGTSLDGIDAALVEAPSLERLEEIRLVAHRTSTLNDLDPARIRDVAAGATTTSAEISALRFCLAAEHARAVEAICAAQGFAPKELNWTAAHGVTLWHAPGTRGGHGWQLHAGAALAARLGCPVIDEFRAADMALGGQGAPLAPLVDLALRTDDAEDRAVLNLGGIANLTLLPAGARSTADIVAADVGPANLPLDAVARESFQESCDRDGTLSARGSVAEALVEAVLAESWVRAALPRSFGREQFGAAWMDELRRRAPRIAAEDLLATLIEIEVRAVAILVDELAGAWRRRLDAPWSLYLTGGGRHNATWVARARALLDRARVTGIEELGVVADAKEAVDFAFLGGQTLRGVRSGTRAVTGASQDLVLGSVHDPHGRLA